MSFNESLSAGRIGESKIAEWLQSRGFNVLPVYEVEQGRFKGPAVFSHNKEEIIAPDILAFKHGRVIWIEAKSKSAFTWHRKTQRWTTGIDVHHYNQYQKIAELVDWPVWLLFLQGTGVAKDTPACAFPPEAGLYGGDLKHLVHNENHRHDGWGKSGMVYWASDVLKRMPYMPDC